MITTDLTIQEEAINKFTENLVKIDKNFEVSGTENILKRVCFESSRKIHSFVKALANVTKEINPESKLSLGKLEALRGIAPKPNLDRILSSLHAVEFNSDFDRGIIFNYIKRSLQKHGTT